MTDPFRYHPELRSLIAEPAQSGFRSFDPETVRRSLDQQGLPSDWINSAAQREADRAQTLACHSGGDLWVFAYGSLMWDPAFHFEEIRHAFAPHHARAFILRDIGGGRGTLEQPGVMAALDEGTGCDGLAFRLAAANIEPETEILWRRERIGPAYRSAYIPLDTAAGRIMALTFLADHDAPSIDAGISWQDQVRFCATGSGFLGTSLDYVENLARHFDALGIEDAELRRLLEAARDYHAG